MSFSIGVLLWPSGDRDEFDLFKDTLDCVSEIEIAPDADSPPGRFTELVIEEEYVPKFEINLASDQAEDVYAHLENRQMKQVTCRLYSKYANLFYDGDRLVKDNEPLVVVYVGSDYVLGAGCKRYGPLRISFDSLRCFQIPDDLIEKADEARRNGKDASKWEGLIAELSHNFDVITNLARRIITRVNPVHLIVCTELEVHPLTAHAIYHRDWQDYVSDLTKIARLHEHGGVYFCQVEPDDPAYLPPRKRKVGYGYIRGRFGDGSERKFVRTIQPMVDKVLRNPEAVRLGRDQVEECFAGLKETIVEEINGGYMLTVKGAPFAYLSEPYFCLYDKIPEQPVRPK